ncbi:MAG: NAD(P)H-quinone oxidoreductase subunit 4, partial [Leptolyngbyaceae cyanobacterium CAN_BIN12]|nr:NAD(P)H-quinone oxidoreductase subunit 4 [Leptolyngbyaceae cyanobacterium CAN_BIN12]
FTIGSMASLALPGMSGFASELAVFVGIATSDSYSASFRTVTILLAAVGLILTPIYLLSMLRQVFYNSGEMSFCGMNEDDMIGTAQQEAVCFGTSCVLPADADFNDAVPREVFIAACFIALIVGIGVYPKLTTSLYDAKTVAVNAHVRQSYSELAQTNPHIYAQDFLVPSVGEPKLAPVVGLVK